MVIGMQKIGVEDMANRGSGEIVLYVDDSEPSRRLIKEIEAKKDGKNIKVIDVDEKRLRGWILLEYGTLSVPLMVTSSKIIEGYERIKRELLENA